MCLYYFSIDSSSSSESESEGSSPPPPAPRVKLLTEEEMNKLGAKIVKAEIMGNQVSFYKNLGQTMFSPREAPLQQKPPPHFYSINNIKVSNKWEHFTVSLSCHVYIYNPCLSPWGFYWREYGIRFLDACLRSAGKMSNVAYIDIVYFFSKIDTDLF